LGEKGAAPTAASTVRRSANPKALFFFSFLFETRLQVRETGPAGLREKRWKCRRHGASHNETEARRETVAGPGVRLKGKLVTEAKGLRVVVPAGTGTGRDRRRGRGLPGLSRAVSSLVRRRAMRGPTASGPSDNLRKRRPRDPLAGMTRHLQNRTHCFSCHLTPSASAMRRSAAGLKPAFPAGFDTVLTPCT